MEKYGNWEPCRGKAGEFGVCRLPDGKLYEAWYIYLTEHHGDQFDQLFMYDKEGKRIKPQPTLG